YGPGPGHGPGRQPPGGPGPQPAGPGPARRTGRRSRVLRWTGGIAAAALLAAGGAVAGLKLAGNSAPSNAPAAAALNAALGSPAAAGHAGRCPLAAARSPAGRPARVRPCRRPLLLRLV